jgi:hypothetical protein
MGMDFFVESYLWARNEIARVEKTGRVDFRAIIVVKEHNAGKHKDPEQKLRK